jgi:hypothetical protein
MLYYALIVQLIFCLYLFNDKLEWVMLIGSFYISILFTYGLISELYKNVEAPEFIRYSDMLNNMGGLFNMIIANKFDIIPYLKYILVIPAILHLSSIKLITSDKGNKKLRKSKSKTAMLNNAKLLICLTTALFAIIVIFGFAPEIEFIKSLMKTKPDIFKIPMFAIPVLLLVSIAEVTLAAIVYQSY